jgi:hypothetical protein
MPDPGDLWTRVLNRVPTLEVSLSQAALYEIGRPDLAECLGTSIMGTVISLDSMILAMPNEDRALIVRAMGVGKLGAARKDNDKTLIQSFEDFLERKLNAR